MGTFVKPSYLDSFTDPFFSWLLGWTVGPYDIAQEKNFWKRLVLRIEYNICPSPFLKMNLAAALGIGFNLIAAIIITHG